MRLRLAASACIDPGTPGSPLHRREKALADVRDRDRIAKAAADGERGKSLLPSGITAVAGNFHKDATITIVGPAGQEVARGLTNYSAEQIAKALDDKPCDGVIHRNNMTLR